MLTRFRNWLILDGDHFPTDLKLGDLDRMDGVGNR